MVNRWGRSICPGEKGRRKSPETGYASIFKEIKVVSEIKVFFDFVHRLQRLKDEHASLNKTTKK